MKKILVLLCLYAFLLSPAIADKSIRVAPDTYRQQLQTMSAGDTLVFPDGEYKNGLSVNNLNGTENTWFVFKSETLHGAVFVGRDGSNTIDITNSSYVQIDGFMFDGKNIANIDAIKAGGGGQNLYTHHINIFNNEIIGHGNNQQTVGISTKITCWDWQIYHNKISSAGTGIYLGNSDGSAPFIRGTIKDNLVVNPTGYCMQIKQQNDRPSISGIPTEPSSTFVVDNVFVKDDRLSPDGDRPNVLFGGQPLSGTGIDDRVEVYGNVFYNNPREYLLQTTGNISIHNNIFVSGSNSGINITTQNNRPPKEVFVYQNSILTGENGIRFDGTKSALITVKGNAVFAKTPLSFTSTGQNLTGDFNASKSHFSSSSFDISTLDVFPKADIASVDLDLAEFSKDQNFQYDFNYNQNNGKYYGCYSEKGTNRGWKPQIDFKLPGLKIMSTIYRVGPTRTYKTPSAVGGLVEDGDTVEIDAGTYSGDVCFWKKNNMVLRGIDGFAHLDANGKSAGSKAIWVIQGNNTTVENIEFSGCTVPDQNGAGIRQEGIGLTVRHCFFHDNDEGILAGDNAQSDILIEFSEFARNGFGDGYSHNLYINHVRSLTFQYNYSHHAKIGHNLKSRAYLNKILYNRIMDEATGNSSFIIDLPNGGKSYVIGNLLMQGPNAENGKMVNYGAEGLSNPENELLFVNNTLVNKRSSATFVYIQSGTTVAKVANNIFAGPGTLISGKADTSANMYFSNPNQVGFADEANYDYRLTKNSSAIDAGVDAGEYSGFSLTPKSEYKHLCEFTERKIFKNIDIGAYEFPDISTQAIEEIVVSDEIYQVYPNPADERLEIKSISAENRFLSVKLINPVGEIVFSESGQDNVSFVTKDLTPGCYFLLIENEKTIVRRKIIIFR